MPTWNPPRNRILTVSEIRLVLSELKRKARRSPLTHRQLVIFRLATCCGLRVSELTRLTLANLRVGVRPAVYVPAAIAKGGKARTVPLHWDGGTLSDLTAWKALREASGANSRALVVCTASGKPIAREDARAAYQSACRLLGRPVTIHDGRHTFISHALHAGRSIVQVQHAAGHASFTTTQLYAHLVEDDDTVVGDIFA